VISGRAIKYGDNVDTDVILPGKYLIYTSPAELAKHAMEGLDSEFIQKVKTRNIIVARENFGCGSSREQAPLALKGAGVKCVIAESIARIFYRNAINIGLPVLECKGIYDKVKDGDELIVKLEQGEIRDKTRNISFEAKPLPKFILEIISDGGLILHLRKEIKK